MLKCDKCGEEVHPSNDAVLVAMEAGTISMVGLLVYGSRHFLPTENCKGSPSRAQYIEGQPRDTRGFVYNEEDEQGWRDDAFARVQEKYPLVDQ
ncbi:MAG: hypothetical protein HZA36_03370 [Parcubacteria group bacterium]|nr:hypothetical protein [Parcubacteria group bacterium]